MDEFMKKNGLEYVVGFSGGSDKEKEEVERVVNDSMLYFSKRPIAVLTGGTKWGIPKIASEIAKDYGMKTIGVMPERGEKYKLSSLDYEMIVPPKYAGSEYGDESEVFVKMCDAIEMIGGNNGTGVEFFHAMKINERRMKEEQSPIYIVPVSGISGFADKIPRLPFLNGASEALPMDPIYEGGDAAKYIMNKLDMI